MRRSAALRLFAPIELASSPHEVRLAIDTQRVLAVLEIGPTLPRYRGGETGGSADDPRRRRSNASQIVSGYLGRIVGAVRGRNAGGQACGLRDDPGRGPQLVQLRTSPTKWFMCRTWSRASALLIGLIVTALSVAARAGARHFRPAHRVTFAHAMRSCSASSSRDDDRPLPHHHLSSLPAVFIFGVRCAARVPALWSAIFYLAAVVGLGLFISALSMTQQQAILGAFPLHGPGHRCFPDSRRRSKHARLVASQ